MRGLPPLPDGLLEFKATMGLGTSECSFTQHFRQDGVDAWSTVEFRSWITAWSTFAQQDLLNCMPSSSGFNVLRLSRGGSVPQSVESNPATNNGAAHSAQAINVCTTLTWKTQLAGLSARSHTSLPMPTEALDGTYRRLNDDFLALFRLQAANYLLHVNEILVTGTIPSELVVLSRSRDGEPLPLATFTPVTDADVSRYAGTLQRRIEPYR